MAPHEVNNNDNVQDEIQFEDPFQCEVPQIPSKVIQRIRKEFLIHYSDNDDGNLYDAEDVQELVVKNDYVIHRYYLSNGMNENLALQSIQKMLKWRRDVQMRYLTDESFPAEFFSSGGLFVYERDYFNTPMIYMRIRLIRKIPELDELLKLFLAYQVNKIDCSCKSLASWALVFDCSGIGIANVQIDMMRYLIHILQDYYPIGIKYIVVFELPWILTAVRKMIFSMIPEDAKKVITFKDRETITHLVSPENLPDFMDGACDVDYKRVPEKCKSFLDVHGSKFNDGQIKRLKQYFTYWTSKQ